MTPLAEWDLSDDTRTRRIELYWGDLSNLPHEHAVDILVVSAFRNDYMPTPSSLIGALYREGISVYTLSFAKSHDMRDEFSCWLSQPVDACGFKRILCVESGWCGSPPELADQLFRALAPATLTNVPTRTVAMPLIGAGDQGYGAAEITEAILRSAVGWFRRGLAVDVLKIVAYSTDAAEKARDRFQEIKQADDGGRRAGDGWDVFLSYSSKDASAADCVQDALARARPGVRVFRDRESLQQGGSWIMQIAAAIDSAERVVALYSPDYWGSVVCKDELSAAYVRQTAENAKILHPIFYRDTNIPSLFRALHYTDCREGDDDKLAATCSAILNAPR